MFHFWRAWEFLFLESYASYHQVLQPHYFSVNIKSLFVKLLNSTMLYFIFLDDLEKMLLFDYQFPIFSFFKEVLAVILVLMR